MVANGVRIPAVTPDKLPGFSVLPHPSHPGAVSNSLPGAVHKHINSTIQHKTPDHLFTYWHFSSTSLVLQYWCPEGSNRQEEEGNSGLLRLHRGRKNRDMERESQGKQKTIKKKMKEERSIYGSWSSKWTREVISHEPRGLRAQFETVPHA